MLAYIDSFIGGLVPARVTEIALGPVIQITVQATADRPGYRRGELTTLGRLGIVPRSAVYRRGYHFRIRPYSWAEIAKSAPAELIRKS